MSSAAAIRGSFAAVSRVRSPVINHVIDKIDRANIFRIHIIMVETRITAVVVCQEVMMERSILAAPYTAISMRTLHMPGITERLRDEAVLHREVLIAVAADALVH